MRKVGNTEMYAMRAANPFDSATTHANNATVSPLTAHRPEAVGRFRRCVALFALAAWTLGHFTCPMPDHGMDVAQAHDEAPALGGHVHEHGQAPAHPESDLCCQLLSGAHAIAQPPATSTNDKALGSSIVAINVTVASLAPETDLATRLIPHSNGPPRNLYVRFATFWAHAPPADYS